MERENEGIDELIDLGVASAETRGAIGGLGDEVGLLPQTGLSDD
jgi:hypothetical protein